MYYNMNKNLFKLENYRSKYPKIFSPEFRDFCKRELFPLYKGRISKEATQADLDKYFKTLGKVGCGLFLVMIVFSILCLFSQLLAIGFFFVVIVIGILCSPLQKPSSITKEEVKEQVFPKLLTFLSCECEHIPEDHPDYNLLPLINSLTLMDRLFKRNYTFYEDRFTLNYKQHVVEMCELKLQYYSFEENHKVLRHGGGNSVFFTTKSNKNMVGRTVVTRRIFDNSNIDIKTDTSVILENTEFNDFYDVYSTDQVEARAFLSPALMCRLVEFAKANKYRDIHLSFESGRINMVLCMGPQINMFELPLWISANVSKTTNDFRKVLVEFSECLSVLDIVKIDEIAGY